MNLIQKLKNLKNIQPSQEWLRETREVFLIQAKKDFVKNKEEKTNFSFAFLTSHLRTATVLGSIVVLLFGSSAFAVNVTKDTLPGDFLYVIKLNLEKTEKILTNDKEKKVKLAIKSSGERLKELKKLSHSKSLVEGEKNTNIKVATQKMDEGIKEIQTSLNNLKEESNPNVTVKTAKIVDEQVAQYRKELSQTKEESNPAIKKEIEKVLDSVEKTNSQAFQTIMDEHKKIKEDVALKKEATDIIENKIKQTEEKIEEVKTKADELTKVSQKQELIINEQGGGEIDKIDFQRNEENFELKKQTDIKITKQENEILQKEDVKAVEQKNEMQKEQEVKTIKQDDGMSQREDVSKIEIKNIELKEQNIKETKQDDEILQGKDVSKIEAAESKKQEDIKAIGVQIKENKETSKEVIKGANKAEEVLKEVKESLKQKDSEKIDLNIIADKVKVSKELVNIAEKIADKAIQLKAQ
ncbi:MAG: DUF5667 domain-containing protein [Patescibacteria group bacterium]